MAKIRKQTKEEKSTWGGKRHSGLTQTAIPLRLDNDLLQRLDEYVGKRKSKEVNRNRMINSAVRQLLNKLDDMIEYADFVEQQDLDL